MFSNDYLPLTLSSIKGGALEEKFQVELEKIMRNIRDWLSVKLPGTKIIG